MDVDAKPVGFRSDVGQSVGRDIGVTRGRKHPAAHRLQLHTGIHYTLPDLECFPCQAEADDRRTGADDCGLEAVNIGRGLVAETAYVARGSLEGGLEALDVGPKLNDEGF